MTESEVPLGFVEDLAANINAPVDLIKTMLLMLSSLLLTPIFRIMKNPILRQIFSLSVGLFYITYLHNYWILYVLAVALVPYVVMRICRSKFF